MRITGTRLKAPTFIIFAVLLAGCSEPQDATDNTAGSRARPARIVELQPSNAGLRRTYPGTLAASQRADLAFRVSGQLVELPAVSGERVRVGDLLAKLRRVEDPAVIAAFCGKVRFATHPSQYFDNDSGQFASPHPDALDPQKSEEIVRVIEAVLGAMT